MIKVNFVISEDKNSRIFHDIFKRFTDTECEMKVKISERPVSDCDLFHYHRPQMEDVLVGPSVVTVHHDLSDPDRFVKYERFHDRYAEADKVICLNSIQQAILNNEKGIRNTIVIPHGYDDKVFTAKKRVVKKEKLTLGVVSKRYDRRFKGEVLLYELMNRLPPSKFEFLFVGEGRSEDAARAHGLGFSVRVFENLPYRIFSSLYDVIDILLMTSNFEGGPANLPEAIASGTPIASTHVGMAPDLIIEGENGLFLIGNPRADFKALYSLTENNFAQYYELLEGAARANTAITWQQVIERHHNCYMSILNESKVDFSNERSSRRVSKVG